MYSGRSVASSLVRQGPHISAVGSRLWRSPSVWPISCAMMFRAMFGLVAIAVRSSSIATKWPGRRGRGQANDIRSWRDSSRTASTPKPVIASGASGSPGPPRRRPARCEIDRA